MFRFVEAFATWSMVLACGCGQSMSEQIQTAPMFSHESAFVAATMVLTGEVVTFESGSDVTVRLLRDGRATVVQLEGTRDYPYLGQPGAGIVVFLASLDGHVGRLVYPPASGGLIWQAPEVLAGIELAARDPAQALASPSARVRLSGAWFVSRERSELTTPARSAIIEAALWAMAAEAPPTAQAGVDIFERLGLGAGVLARFNPLATPAIRRELAAELRSLLP